MITKAVKTIRSIVNLMHARERNTWATPEDKAEHYARWAAELEYVPTLLQEIEGKEKEILEAVVDAMRMQDKREAGELHLSQEAALPIWHRAKLAGEALVIARSAVSFGYSASHHVVDDALAGRLPIPEDAQAPGDPRLIAVDIDGVFQVNPALASNPAAKALADRILEVPEAQAVGHLKKRAESITRGLRKFGIQLKHGQALRVVASMEGHTSFESLRRKLDRHAPNFCPHCGAAGTLEKVDTVFCEQGEYDGRNYESEGEGAQYACSQCRGQFNDWSGL
jgi:hypothetical protein